MNELLAALKIALANTYVMYAKAQSYHWNVEGIMFSMYHEFFGDIYSELHGPIDDLAERIRTLDAFAPFSLADILAANTVGEDQARVTDLRTMINNLLAANTETTASLNKAFALAEQFNLQGLMDLIAARLDAHAKTGWMLKSSLKNTGV